MNKALLFKHWLFKQHPVVLFYFTFWLIYFSWFWFNLFQFNSQGDLTIGQANIWADWALHFTLGNNMTVNELIPPTSPLLINTDFSYPFAINLISALLMRSGLDMLTAFILPSFFFSLLLVFSLYYFFYHLFKQPVLKKQVVAVIGCFIFFFNGGIGFYYLLQDSIVTGDIFYALLNPAKELTHINDQQIKWMSVINSLFLPQRSLMMGFPLCLLALTQILTTFRLNKTLPDNSFSSVQSSDFIKLSAAAVILGLMPIIHLHSFLAAFIILLCWMLADLVRPSDHKRYIRLKYWFGFATMVSCIALPILYTFYFSHISIQHFSWHPGWMAKDFTINWFVFWFKNWTIVPLLAVFGWLVSVLKHKSGDRLTAILLFLPFFLLFALVNLILLQPWVWDNTKILVWASVGFSGLSAYLLSYLLVKPVQARRSLTKKTLFILLFFSIIVSGAIDVYRNIRMDLHRYTLYTQDELSLAEWVKNNTDSQSIWLVSPRHNHWLFNLTGRQAVFTYNGWLWSHGINYQATEQDLKTIFKTADSSKLKKYHVNYVILDSYTKKYLKSNNLLFIFQYPLVKTQGQYQIFKIQ